MNCKFIKSNIGCAIGAAALALGLLHGCATQTTGGENILSVDHYVSAKSSVPSLAGQPTRIFVRERVKAGGGKPRGVVLFVHGAGTPANVAFDVPHRDYSWMAYLAAEGFDTFAMDLTGYGRSTRPAGMENPCNLSPKQQAGIVPAGESCKPTQAGPMAQITSEWEEIDAVVEHIRKLRGVQKVSLIAWSRGGPRAGGYAALHPDKIERLVLLAPGYLRTMPATAPKPAAGTALMNSQSRQEFIANWDRQVGCPNQYDTATLDAVWADMIASDPVGSKWGTGVRRAPNTSVFGWTTAVVAKSRTPILVVAGEHDKQVVPERVKQLYDDSGAPSKVFIQLACSSHNAMWEMNRGLMFRASLEWLSQGTVNGQRQAALRMGY